jgi:hypothetical protein
MACFMKNIGLFKQSIGTLKSTPSFVGWGYIFIGKTESGAGMTTVKDGSETTSSR